MDMQAITKPHRIAQERILELERTIDTIDSENDKLRETVHKQDSKIAFLNVTLASANQNTEYQLSRLPTTAMAALKLFIKMLFGVKRIFKTGWQIRAQMFLVLLNSMRFLDLG